MRRKCYFMSSITICFFIFVTICCTIYSESIYKFTSGSRYIYVTQSKNLWPTDFSIVKISAEINGENDETLKQNSVVFIVNNQDEQIITDINYINATTEKVVITGANMKTKEILVTFQECGNGIDIKVSR